MATNVDERAFLSGKCGKLYDIKAGFCGEHLRNMSFARRLVWNELSKYKMTATLLKGCNHFYWTDQLPAASYVKNMFSIAGTGNYHSVLRVPFNITDVGSEYLTMNSNISVLESCKISAGATICDSNIDIRCFTVGERCWISGLYTENSCDLSLDIPKDIIIITYLLPGLTKISVTVVFGIHDKLCQPITHQNSTFANRPWSKLFERLDENDIWDCSIEISKRNLLNAKIYPIGYPIQALIVLLKEDYLNDSDLLRWKQTQRYSIAEVLQAADHSKQFDFRRDIHASVATSKIRRILYENENKSLLPYFHLSFAEGWAMQLIISLDLILTMETQNVIITRTLSAMADLLGTIAGKAGGLRNGPGSNKCWSNAFKHLTCGRIKEGIKELTNEREKWLDGPAHIMRAARHYERASHILIQQSVLTVEKFVTLELTQFSEMGTWIVAECPARIDLQGGWTDTPPISYELGGSVVNIAIAVDGKKPIGAKARRIESLNIELLFGAGEMSTKMQINDVKEILDYDQPNAQGALLKAALIYAKIVDVNSTLSLKEQLSENCHSGIQLNSWSHLPQGCGLGTSSILAGAIISALWCVTGRKFDNSSVIHAVLCIEQLLTTGGGWQDQVGGIVGGIKRGFSRCGLPHHVEVCPLPVKSSFFDTLNSHLLLVYTGKVRLAKNLLQNVIRNWYARDAAIVGCFKSLIYSSMEMKNAIIKENLEEIGALLDLYWKQKMILAPGCEPVTVKKIIETLRDIAYGQVMCGAGGGGFLCILTKQPNVMTEVKTLLSKMKNAEKISVHSVTIDISGMTLSI